MARSDSGNMLPMEGVAPGELGLFTDLYELTMLQAYFEEEMMADAVFSLFVRRLPAHRNFLLACGLDTVLDYLENLRFTDEAIAYLRSLGRFSDRFLAWLGEFRFTGDVFAVPEGTPVFANEPILEIVAPLPQAQLIETYVMNQIHVQTVLASKAQRVVTAAAGRSVIDFGARRIHGTDAALKAVRAFYIGGVAATSNVLAGKRYGVPIAGTMAHSYIQAHDDEAAAFRAFVRLYPDTVLLVDTYDTLEGVRKVIELAKTLAKTSGSRRCASTREICWRSRGKRACCSTKPVSVKSKSLSAGDSMNMRSLTLCRPARPSMASELAPAWVCPTTRRHSISHTSSVNMPAKDD